MLTVPLPSHQPASLGTNIILPSLILIVSTKYLTTRQWSHDHIRCRTWLPPLTPFNYIKLHYPWVRQHGEIHVFSSLILYCPPFGWANTATLELNISPHRPPSHAIMCIYLHVCDNTTVVLGSLEQLECSGDGFIMSLSLQLTGHLVVL